MDDHTNKSDKKESNRKANKIVLPIIGIVFLVLIVAVVASMVGNAKSAKFTAAVDKDGIHVVDATKVNFGYHVTNSGTASGQPNCNLYAFNSSNQQIGLDYIQLKSNVDPGQTVTGADTISISNNDAKSVTKVTINCS